MDWKLEVLVIPVSDVDRAKDFYKGRENEPHDHAAPFLHREGVEELHERSEHEHPADEQRDGDRGRGRQDDRDEPGDDGDAPERHRRLPALRDLLEG